MNTRTLFFAVMVSLLFASPAFALTLNEARASGALGEQRDGYVAVLKETNAVKVLAKEVNAKRKEAYEHISKENGQPISVVAKLAASQIVEKLAKGSSYQAADKSWRKK